MKASTHGVSFACALSLISSAVAFNQSECLAQLHSGHLRGLTGNNRSVGLDHYGQPTDEANATAISYLDCISLCPGGSGKVPFNWTIFTQQVAAWLVPWLALLSQLPYGAERKWHDILSMILTLGSPTFAGYSLALTSLNNFYVASRFSNIRHRNTGNVARVLAGLQQIPLRIVAEDVSPSSLVKEQEAWEKLSSSMTLEHPWSISALAAIAWVIIAYILTVVDAFSLIGNGITRSDGPAVGSLWVWLLPVVVGWLIVSPQTDAISLRNALRGMGNQLQRDGAKNGEGSTLGISYVSCLTSERLASKLLLDETYNSPIFNASRVFSWDACVNHVADAFCCREESEDTVHSSIPAQHAGEIRSRAGSYSNRRHKAFYQEKAPHTRHWEPSVMMRMFLAALMGLLLQWCTSGAAFLITSHAPTTGMGCRSASYIVYASGSTAVWFMMLLSIILGRQSTRPSSSSGCRRCLCYLSIGFNAFSKVVAAINGCWIICACLLQFGNVFNNCFCNSGVYGRGALNAFSLLAFTEDDRYFLKGIWIGGVSMSLASAGVYVAFIWVHQCRANRCNTVTSPSIALMGEC